MKIFPKRLVLALYAATLLTGPAVAAGKGKPLLIAHRGASAERPEHTASAYILAIEQGADFIEPDLVVTKDGALLDRHENEISETTDVSAHPEFAARKTTKTVDGQKLTGWFTEDFTLAELKTLRARERLPQVRPANTAYDGKDQLLTFQEVIALAKREGKKRGRTVGVYAELKHPTYFAAAGLPMADRFVTVAKAEGLSAHDAPLFLQAFETDILKQVRKLSKVRTVLLMDEAGAPADFVAAGSSRKFADLATPAGLKEVAAYADGIGPAKAMIVPRDAAGRSLAPTKLVADAHAAGLVVHPWTFRPENVFLPAELRKGVTAEQATLALRGDMAAEVKQFLALGVDGLFTDAPGLARPVIDAAK